MSKRSLHKQLVDENKDLLIPLEEIKRSTRRSKKGAIIFALITAHETIFIHPKYVVEFIQKADRLGVSKDLLMLVALRKHVNDSSVAWRKEASDDPDPELYMTLAEWAQRKIYGKPMR